MKKDLGSKSILETLFMSLIIMILILMSLYIPIISLLLIPVYTEKMYLKCSKIRFGLLMIIDLIIPIIIMGSVILFLTAIVYSIIGIILGICIKRNVKVINIVSLLSITTILANFAILTSTVYLFMKINFWKFAENIVYTFNESIKVYSKLGVDISSNDYFQSLMKIMTPENILITLPSIIIIFSVVIAFLIYIISGKLGVKNYEIKKVAKFDKWYVDAKIGAFLIIFSCVGMILSSKDILIGKYIYTTAYSLLQCIIFIVGLSILNYFIKNKLKFSKKSTIVMLIIVLISPISIILPFLGLVDLIADVRGIDPNSLGTALRKKYLKDN